MNVGIIVLMVLAAIWAITGLVVISVANKRAWTWSYVVPVAISATLLTLGKGIAVAKAQRWGVDDLRIERVLVTWSAVEAVVIVGAVVTMRQLSMSHMILPVIGVIMGLHLLPIADGLDLPVYFVSGSALVTLSIIALLIGGELAPPVTAFGAAIILWATGMIVAVSGGS